jgi:hypothetical protein
VDKTLLNQLLATDSERNKLIKELVALKHEQDFHHDMPEYNTWKVRYSLCRHRFNTVDKKLVDLLKAADTETAGEFHRVKQP